MTIIKIKKRLNGSIQTRRANLAGWLFVSPFVFGFLFLFLQPLITSLYYSLSNVSFERGSLSAQGFGLHHYIFAFTKDAAFPPLLWGNLMQMLINTVVVLLFSLFAAVILNQNFKGKTLARAIFFLPVIVTSGIIIFILKQDIFNRIIQTGNSSSNFLFQSLGFQDMMLNLRIPYNVINVFTSIVNTIFDILWKTGVQILIFLASLQSVPAHLYEAAKIDGATSWESFWKITLPMVSPVIIINLVYTIIDSFTDYSNPLMLSIQQTGFEQMRYSYSCAMSWIFFIIVFAAIGLVNLIFSRFVFYQAD